MARPSTKSIKAGGGEADEVSWPRRRTTTAQAAISKKRRREAAAEAAAGRCVGRRIRILRELVPGCGGEAAGMGLEGLFREAADYIVYLQVQVKVMQMVLHQLSPAQQVNDDDDDDDGDGDGD